MVAQRSKACMAASLFALVANGAQVPSRHPGTGSSNARGKIMQVGQGETAFVTNPVDRRASLHQEKTNETIQTVKKSNTTIEHKEAKKSNVTMKSEEVVEHKQAKKSNETKKPDVVADHTKEEQEKKKVNEKKIDQVIGNDENDLNEVMKVVMKEVLPEKVAGGIEEGIAHTVEKAVQSPIAEKPKQDLEHHPVHAVPVGRARPAAHAHAETAVHARQHKRAGQHHAEPTVDIESMPEPTVDVASVPAPASVAGLKILKAKAGQQDEHPHDAVRMLFQLWRHNQNMHEFAVRLRTGLFGWIPNLPVSEFAIHLQLVALALVILLPYALIKSKMGVISNSAPGGVYRKPRRPLKAAPAARPSASSDI